jgi:hypothetical protein
VSRTQHHLLPDLLTNIRVFKRICLERGWCAELFSGEMSFEARNKAIERFSDPEQGCRILLAGMKAGGVGVNLTAANVSYLVLPIFAIITVNICTESHLGGPLVERCSRGTGFLRKNSNHFPLSLPFVCCQL